MVGAHDWMHSGNVTGLGAGDCLYFLKQREGEPQA